MDNSKFKKKVKAVILTEIISPYRIQPFNKLAQDDAIDLEVFFYAETEGRRRWHIRKEEIRFSYQVLWGMQVGQLYQGGPLFLNPNVIYRLWKSNPDVIILGGWHHPTSYLSMMYAKLMGIRVLLWSESTIKDQRSNHPFKEVFKRWFVHKVDGCIVPGKAQKDYLVYLGARSDRICIAPNAVDTDFFTHQAESYQAEREKLKSQMGIYGLIVLYVGRLIDEKGIPNLLTVFESRLKELNVTLVLVGDGPEEKKYRLRCQKNKLENVYFAGFQDQIDLPKYYAISDVFVFPTYSDPWGLVLNEAMAAGLPIVCSSDAGAAGDLVEQEGNGYLYSPDNIKQLFFSLNKLLLDAKLRKRMGERSRQIIQAFTPDQMADGFKKSILNSLSTTSHFDRLPC